MVICVPAPTQMYIISKIPELHDQHPSWELSLSISFPWYWRMHLPEPLLAMETAQVCVKVPSLRSENLGPLEKLGCKYEKQEQKGPWINWWWGRMVPTSPGKQLCVNQVKKEVISTMTSGPGQSCSSFGKNPCWMVTLLPVESTTVTFPMGNLSVPR